jgi:hypothetical protein
MMAVTTMAPMHEEVHEWAGKEREPDEDPPDMRAMLGEQERAGNDDEAQQRKPGARGQKAPARFVLMAGVIMKGH